jgi:hypothetical protein
MCSSTSARLARIYRAIDELENLGAAGRGVEAGGSAGASGGAEGDGVADGDSEADTKGDGRTGAEGESGADADVASRLAEIWAMIADADPELAKRLPRYLGPNS